MFKKSQMNMIKENKKTKDIEEINEYYNYCKFN